MQATLHITLQLPITCLCDETPMQHSQLQVSTITLMSCYLNYVRHSLAAQFAFVAALDLVRTHPTDVWWDQEPAQGNLGWSISCGRTQPVQKCSSYFQFHSGNLSEVGYGQPCKRDTHWCDLLGRILLQMDTNSQHYILLLSFSCCDCGFGTFKKSSSIPHCSAVYCEYFLWTTDLGGREFQIENTGWKSYRKQEQVQR